MINPTEKFLLLNYTKSENDFVSMSFRNVKDWMDALIKARYSNCNCKISVTITASYANVVKSKEETIRRDDMVDDFLKKIASILDIFSNPRYDHYIDIRSYHKMVVIANIEDKKDPIYTLVDCESGKEISIDPDTAFRLKYIFDLELSKYLDEIKEVDQNENTSSYIYDLLHSKSSMSNILDKLDILYRGDLSLKIDD